MGIGQVRVHRDHLDKTRGKHLTCPVCGKGMRSKGKEYRDHVSSCVAKRTDPQPTRSNWKPY